MTIQIRLAKAGHREVGKGWRKGAVLAEVDGYSVALLERKGWSCQCSSTLPTCEHIAALIPLIDVNTLAKIEEGRRTP